MTFRNPAELNININHYLIEIERLDPNTAKIVRDQLTKTPPDQQFSFVVNIAIDVMSTGDPVDQETARNLSAYVTSLEQQQAS